MGLIPEEEKRDVCFGAKSKGRYGANCQYDARLDAAVFCLSLMGSNFTDYLREAHRTLKLDGHLHIFEPTQKFSDRDAFVRDLETLGFGFSHVEQRWKFTYIRAEKTTRPPDAEIVLRFSARN